MKHGPSPVGPLEHCLTIIMMRRVAQKMVPLHLPQPLHATINLPTGYPSLNFNICLGVNIQATAWRTDGCTPTSPVKQPPSPNHDAFGNLPEGGKWKNGRRKTIQLSQQHLANGFWRGRPHCSQNQQITHVSPDVPNKNYFGLKLKPWVRTKCFAHHQLWTLLMHSEILLCKFSQLFHHYLEYVTDWYVHIWIYHRYQQLVYRLMLSWVQY